jgi:mRNA interferase HigB
VKSSFSAADFDPKSETYIFDVGGNKYRVLASIDFEERVLSVESVMTHEQYSRR